MLSPKTQTQKLLENPGALCNMVRRTAIGAGHLTLDYFDEGKMLAVKQKSDGSPVTLADAAAEKYIRQALFDVTPDIPMVGEESSDDGIIPDLETTEYFWLVDPLDGTKEFMTGGRDYTVNIALINMGQPILGVVYAPARGVLYAGHGPGTAIRWNEETEKDKSIRPRRPPAEGLIVMGSQRHNDDNKFNAFLERYKVSKIIKLASSLKICAVAEGKADMYPRLGPTCEWDTAAAEAVLISAGGFLRDINGRPLAYGKSGDKFLNPFFIASSFEWFDITD